MSSDALNLPFKLRLSVEQQNKPPHIFDISSMSIWTTLRHTPVHLITSIWLLSKDYELKPLFTKLSKNGNVLEPHKPLSEILNTQQPQEDFGILLTIDYTLFEAPFVPKLEPMPQPFDVKVTLKVDHGPEIKAHCSCTLLDAVEDVKEKVSKTLGLSKTDFELSIPGSEQYLNDDDILRKVLSLDVEPLQPVMLEAKKPESMYKLRIFPIGDEQASVDIMIYASTTVCELRDQVAQTFDKEPRLLNLFFRTHCFSKATSVPSQVKLSELFSFADYKFDSPYSIGFRCTEVEGESGEGERGEGEVEGESGEGERREGESGDSGEGESGEAETSNVLDVFELEMNGEKVELTSSECKVCDGNVMLSPEAVDKLNQSWNIDVRHLLATSSVSATDQEVNGTEGQQREEISESEERVVESEDTPLQSDNTNDSALQSDNSNDSAPHSENTNSDPHSENTNSDPHSENTNSDPHSDNTNDLPPQSQNLIDQTHADETLQIHPETNVNIHENIPLGADDVIVNVPMRGAIQTIAFILIQNREVILKSIIQVLLAAFFMIGESILVLAKTSVLVPLSLLTICIAFFSFGSEISSWIDDNILSHSTPNTLDYNAVRIVSGGFRMAHTLSTSLETLINEWYLWMLRRMHTRKYLALERRVFDEGGIVAAKSMCYELLTCMLMSISTILPVLEHSTQEYVNSLAREEDDEMMWLITGYLKKLEDGEGDETRRRMQERLNSPIERVSTDDENYADRLRLYLMLAWVVKRGQSLDMMPSIR